MAARFYSDYMKRYHEWRDKQVCLGCNAKSGSDVGYKSADRKQWMTEYLCIPCWESGVRGEPREIFDGYSGTIRIKSLNANDFENQSHKLS